MNKPRQLTLNIRLRDDSTFDNFYSKNNQQLIFYLRKLSCGNEQQFTYIWGKSGCGRSHLLQACCQVANESGLSSIYLPLSATELSPQILEDLEIIQLLCLDDIQGIAGQYQWEEAIFHIFNKLLDKKKPLLISADRAPFTLPINLPDLKSRLSSGVTFQIQPLSDDQKLTALRLRAKARGLYLSYDASKFLLNRYPRDTTSLFAALEKLDQTSLSTQHRLTIPFIKSVL
ncbi:MAG: hypothetical protein AMJ43_04880 [Coxiella sp. DG_40]|nr:MAG: hypothetical protein AMJ43_04880 [Coxiella sp. DG_40]